MVDESKEAKAKNAVMKKKLEKQQKLKDKKKEGEEDGYDDIENMLGILEAPLQFDSA